MDSETKQCQNCKQNFTIEPEDFVFYEKIKVPAPTFCPDCRLIFRISWRNERSLYYRNCSLCNKKIFSIYDNFVPFPVYCNECWWSDKWDSMGYGQSYDFSKPFFEQLKELQKKVPRINLNVLDVHNSPFANQVWHSKNVYMSFDVGYGEDLMYCKACHFLKDSVDCSYSKKIELCYECINTRDSSHNSWLLNCDSCLDSNFLKNCKNCFSCVASTNLRNKNHYILNKPFSKEDFEKEKNKYVNGSYSGYKKILETFRELNKNSIHKEHENLRAVDCSGNYIWDSKNCRDCFNIFKSENCRFANDVDSDLKDSMDVSHAAEAELVYNSCVVGGGSDLICNWAVVGSHNVLYSILCLQNNANLFGCVGLNKKQNCILNNQYTKEEYDRLIPKIKEHMDQMPYVDKKGRVYKYGEFFPPELSSFAYNEATVQEYFPLTKEQAIEQGYSWKESENRNLRPTTDNQQLPDHIKDVTDDILKEIIQCQHSKIKEDGSLEQGCNEQCTTAFKIIPQELEFYRKMNLPLPRLCPNCRHYQRIKQRNPLKLWERTCQCAGNKSENGVYQNTATHQHGEGHCKNTFETTYAPDRPEIVYCEQCYNAEVA